MAANPFDHLKATFFQECAELIDSAYVDLAALDEGRADAETIHAIFRAVHSIKGGGGAFGFDRMVGFAHVLETLLDLLRDGKVPLGQEVGALLLRATDALSDLIAADRTGQPAAPAFENALLSELRSLASASDIPAAVIDLAAPEPSILAAPTAYRIEFQPYPELFKSANDPLLLIRALQALGEASVLPQLGFLPTLERMDPESAYIGWTVVIRTSSPITDIEEVFEFVSDQCDLSIQATDVLEDKVFSTDCSVEQPALTHTNADIPAAPMVPAVKHADVAAIPQTVRVDVAKVDRLVNLVGELVINQAMLIQLGSTLPPGLCAGLMSGLETLSQHLRELQDGVMAIRTQPVRSVFSRMPRLVRELSSQLGKDARLYVTGEATEVDKMVIEQLADPLTHLLRNALDHGIESPAERITKGKPVEGSIHLSAQHRSGRIVIEVSDDGAGIDRDRVLLRARKRGMISQDAQPSDEEIDNLIFLPGFSTVDVVSNISGRGVGMDVVRRNIQALGGRISLQSRWGYGSRFVLSLPLTLAILDGMIVAVGGESYIVPLTNIVESLRPRRRDIHAVAGCGDVVDIRGEYIPLIYLAAHFSVTGAILDAANGIVVVVESEDSGQVGLVVDELLGQQQVVVKSLEENYGDVDGVGGATILGNGRVALILDVAGLRELTSRTRSLAGQRSGQSKSAAVSAIQ